jgi:hypothetical protein
MDTENEIRLRLRFSKNVATSTADLQEKFRKYRDSLPEDYFVKVHDEHIWLNFKGTQKHYWSPHLHLELEPNDDHSTTIRGLFGPDATLWTLFMFLHFIIAGVFITFAMIAYSNYCLHQPYMINIIALFVMLMLWGLLYVIARQIREKGHDQMNQLERAFLTVIK